MTGVCGVGEIPPWLNGPGSSRKHRRLSVNSVYRSRLRAMQRDSEPDWGEGARDGPFCTSNTIGIRRLSPSVVPRYSLARGASLTLPSQGQHRKLGPLLSTPKRAHVRSCHATAWAMLGTWPRGALYGLHSGHSLWAAIGQVWTRRCRSSRACHGTECAAWPAPAWEGRQGAEAAPVGSGTIVPPPGRDALEGKGPPRRPHKRLGRWLEEVVKAVGGGYCRL